MKPVLAASNTTGRPSVGSVPRPTTRMSPLKLLSLTGAQYYLARGVWQVSEASSKFVSLVGGDHRRRALWHRLAARKDAGW
jgi:hypothetical protein